MSQSPPTSLKDPCPIILETRTINLIWKPNRARPATGIVFSLATIRSANWNDKCGIGIVTR